MNLFKLAVTIATPYQLGRGPANLGELLNNIFNFLNYLIGVIAVVMIIYSGYMYVVSVGNPQKTKQALQSIIYVAVGFAVAILARGIAEFVLPKVQNRSDVGGVVTDSLNVFLWAIGIASVIVIIIGAIKYIVSVGEPAKTREAKDAILYAVIGLVITVLAGGAIAGLNTFLRTGHF